MAASQDKDFSVVTAARPQGTASTERSLFARPPQIVIPQPSTNAGPVRRGVSDRTTSLRGLAEQRGAHKPVANGGIVAEELLDPGFEPGQPGAPGDRRQLLWVKSSGSAVPPFVRPIAPEYPQTLGNHGVPQWDRGDDTDKF